MAEEAVRRIAAIYRIERELSSLQPDERLALRQANAKPHWVELHQLLQHERSRVADGGATAKAIDYSLNNWSVLTRNLLDGAVPLDSWTTTTWRTKSVPARRGARHGRSRAANWPVQRAAIMMRLVQSARLNGHDPWAYRRTCETCCSDCLRTLTAASRKLLPHRWGPQG